MAVVVAVAYLLAPPMGRDFSAQLAHAELAELHWPALLDLRWYGGFSPLGYSVLSPPVMALLGVPLTTVLSYVATVVLFAALLKATGVARPVAGAIVGGGLPDRESGGHTDYLRARSRYRAWCAVGSYFGTPAGRFRPGFPGTAR
ncbi:MAG TPA: hypothetical protein VFO20_09420 [Propionibacteriaceae bacterium]|nr:hypothetical protein [Propionibacteriaceae bacterium]